MDFKKVFDAHWSTIQAAKEVRDYYAKGNLICSDVVGELINAINGAEKLYNIKLRVEEDKHENKDEEHA